METIDLYENVSCNMVVYRIFLLVFVYIVYFLYSGMAEDAATPTTDHARVDAETTRGGGGR